MDSSSQDSAREPSPSEEKKTSRRPANTAFRQQRLKAWQPILTPKNVIWIFFVLGVFAAIVGGLLIYASRMVSSIELDYTDCGSQATTDDYTPMPSGLVKSYWRNNGSADINALWKRVENVNFTYNNYELTGLTNCSLQFKILQDMNAPVRAYYHLDNFYQNHRRYVNSFNADQLLAKNVTTSTLDNSDCAPLAVEDFDEDGQKKTRQIYPCGLIANSLFNDTIGRPFRLGVDGTPESKTYNWTDNDIAWDSDKELYNPLEHPDYDLIIPPPNWRIRYPDEKYSSEHPPPNLKEDEHFISWMRTAALPSFFKPWAFGNETLVAGTYSVDILDNFNMTKYKGKKSIVITTTGPLGGKNDLPGILWLALSGFFIVLSLVFVVGSFIRPRKLGDHTLLSWNKVPSASAKGKGKAPTGPTIGMSTGRDL